MTTEKSELAVALYDLHTRAEDAVKALQRAGFDMKKISIIGRDYHTEERVIGFLNAGDIARTFGKMGAFWGRLMGILFGSEMLFLPVVGHVIVPGPLAASIFGGLEGTAMVGGASALAGALMAAGVPKNSVLRYKTALKSDKFALIVHGDSQEIEHARDLLKTSGFSSFDHHGSNNEAATPANS